MKFSFVFWVLVSLLFHGVTGLNKISYVSNDKNGFVL